MRRLAVDEFDEFRAKHKIMERRVTVSKLLECSKFPGFKVCNSR